MDSTTVLVISADRREAGKVNDATTALLGHAKMVSGAEKI